MIINLSMRKREKEREIQCTSGWMFFCDIYKIYDFHDMPGNCSKGHNNANSIKYIGCMIIYSYSNANANAQMHMWTHLYLPKQIIKKWKATSRWAAQGIRVSLNPICILRYADAQDIIYIYSNFFPCWQKGKHFLQLPLWLWPVVRRRWWKKGRIAHWLPNNNPNNDGSIFSPRNADAILWNSLKSTHELPRPENCLCPYLQQVMIINKTEKMEN